MEGIVTTLANPQTWAQRQFGSADLGDQRRTRRAVWYAARAAANSAGSIPSQAGSAAGMKAIYRLFDAPAVSHAAIIAPHLEQTRRVAGLEPIVFLVQDTTELNFSSHPHCKGLGSVGGGFAGTLRGLHQQNVLAVTPADSRPLGLMYQKHHRRTLRPKGHGRDRKAQRGVPMKERESYWWVEAIDAIGAPPPGVRWVHVGDRAEDFFSAYDRIREHKADWLIRSARDRRVDSPAGSTRLFQYARSLSRAADQAITVRDKAKNTTRRASLCIATGPVTLPPVKGEPECRGCQPVACSVVRVWEPQPPPGVPTLEWILLTSLPCSTPEETAFVAQGYALRWVIEEFHKCEKTGCQVEARRLENAERLEPLIGLLSVLAVQLLGLKLAARDDPEQPAEDVLPHEALRVMANYLHHKGERLTVGEFWRGIGLLGGHPGRPSDGPLGWLRAWRGWDSFQLILLGARLVQGPSG